MNKTVVTLIVVILALALGLKLLSMNNKPKIILSNQTNQNNLKSFSVTVENEMFDLVNGKAEKAFAPDSATKNILWIFGEPVVGDLNGDGIPDTALLLANDLGGTGVFYYAVLAIATTSGYQITNTMFLGDRIAPQTINIQDGRAVYNFAERKAGEAFSVPPSVGKSVWVNYDAKTNEIGEWVKNFEGEADPNSMTLGMKKWNWVSTKMNDGKVVTPVKQNAFSITFKNDGNFSATTDCNGVGGSYVQNGKNITFSKMMSTLMYCENSQEQEFTKSLGEVGSYLFTSKGELVLMLKMDSGTMTFR